MSDIAALGFIGLGVMGEPMCRNLARGSALPVYAYDIDPAPLDRLSEAGVRKVATIAEIGVTADVIFLSLPGGAELESVCAELESRMTSGIVVDHTTSPVGLTRWVASRLSAKNVHYADAPVARTRAAAEEGTLAIMVGAKSDTYTLIEPFLRCMGTDISHCGDIGAGQVVKLMNNLVLFATVNALAESLAMGKAAGVDPEVLFGTMSKGSADSFALRNHGMKALLSGDFPERSFSTRYALKDLAYALELADEAGIDARGARLLETILEDTIAAGYGDNYFPALARLLEQ